MSDILSIEDYKREKLECAIEKVRGALRAESKKLEKYFDAILITRDGFMRMDSVYGAPPRLRIPRKTEAPICVPSEPLTCEVTKGEEYAFYLDTPSSTGNVLIYREH